ncbi:MAG: PAS domain-containing sensor histidine kinase [Promethearchaeota archaeon]|jgi:PAS domain S-box-containing protein
MRKDTDTNSKEFEVEKAVDNTILNPLNEPFITTEEMYKNIINNLMDIIIVLDLRGNFLYVSPQIYEISGFKQEEIVGKNGFKLMHPDDIKKAAESLKEALDKKNKIYIEYRTIHKNGSYIDVSASGRIVNIDGEDRVFAVVRDLTEQKRSEKKSEKKYRQLIEDAFEGVWVIDENAFTTLVNPSMSRILGYEADEMIGRSLYDFTLQEDIETTKKTLERRRKGIKEEIEKKFIRKDGNEVLTRLMSSPIFDNDSRYIGAIAFVSDITERKNTENLLKESEEKFRTLFELAPSSTIVSDTEGKIIFYNEKFCKLHDVKKPELLKGRSVLEFFAKKDWPKLAESIRKTAEGVILEPIQYTMIKEDGTPFEAEANSSGIRDKNGNIVNLIGVAQDITERMKKDQKLRDSESKYRNLSIQYKMLLESITDAVYALNRDWEYIIVNKNAEKIINMPIENLLGHSIFEVFPGIEQTPFFETYKKVMNTGNAERVINTFKLPDGHKGYYEVSVYPIEEGILCIAKDVTEEKEFEQKLKDSEEKYSHLFKSSPQSIIIGDMKGNIIDCNFKEGQITGRTREELIGKNMMDIKMFPPESLPVVMKNFGVLLKGEIPNSVEVQIFKKDGSRIWVQPSASIFKLKDKMYFQIIMQDINDRKKSEESLRDSEEKFRTLFEIAPASIVVLDLEGNINLSNQKFRDLHGIKTQELLEERNIRDFFKKSDLPKLQEAMKRSLDGIQRGINQYTMLKQDGTEFPAEAISSGIKNKNGEITGLIGVAQDISKRNKSEQKLRESEEKFRTITEQSFMAISILQDGEFKYLNQKMTELTGYSVEEMLEWVEEDITKTVYPDDLKLIAKPYQKNKNGDPLSFKSTTFRSIRKDGKIRWLETFSKKIDYEGKPATLTTYMDITEKKEAEQELIKLNSLKSELLRRTSHELKTPLVSIKGYSDLLLSVHKEKLDDYVLSSIVEIKQGCERLESLIQDILNTSELESGAIQLKKTEEDLSFLIKLSIRELKGITRLRNHAISLDIHDKLIASFEQEQIHRVISSLLNNAIKYTPPNGKIKIKTEIKDSLIQFSIRDSGIGLTEEEKKLLFSQFGKIERYGQGYDIISDGSGLGLYISKKIIELHGGEIWVESEGRNKGSTFYFTLPLIKKSTD